MRRTILTESIRRVLGQARSTPSRLPRLGIELLEGREVPAALYAVRPAAVGTGTELIWVDTSAKQMIPVGTIAANVADVTRAPDGSLYGVTTATGVGASGDAEVVRISVPTLSVTRVARSPLLNGAVAMTAGGDGSLYIAAPNPGFDGGILVRVIPATAQVGRSGIVLEPTQSWRGNDAGLAFVGSSLTFTGVVGTATQSYPDGKAVSVGFWPPASGGVQLVGAAGLRASNLVAADNRLYATDAEFGSLVAIDPATRVRATVFPGRFGITGMTTAPSAPPVRPDVTARGLGWDAAAGGLQAAYSVSGSLALPAVGQVFWASGPTYAQRLGSAVYEFALGGQAGLQSRLVPFAALATPPDGATHLVLVIDPPSLGRPGGTVGESDEGNNAASLKLLLTAQQLLAVMPNLKGWYSATTTGPQNRPVLHADTFVAPLNAAMTEHGINNPKRIAAFLAQLTLESASLTSWEENLNYSTVARLRAVFPTAFRAMTDGQASAYLHQPEKLANFVYATRNGNRGQASGDGWRYRGLGPIQLTGRNNYIAAGAALGLSVVDPNSPVNRPDLLADFENNPVLGFRTAAWFFASQHPLDTTGGLGLRGKTTLTDAQLALTLLAVADLVDLRSAQSLRDVNKAITAGINTKLENESARLAAYRRALVAFFGEAAVAHV